MKRGSRRRIASGALPILLLCFLIHIHDIHIHSRIRIAMSWAEKLELLIVEIYPLLLI
jgi:hypothetical protein